MQAILLSLNDVISWVVGRGGLLGGSVERALAARGPTWHPPREFTWDCPPVLDHELTTACQAFAAEVGRLSWQIAWCAGAGVVGSEFSDLDQETSAFTHLLTSVAEVLCRRGRSSGAMFFASSAGGVYAGVGNPPFDEDSPVAPIAPYGWNKLAQESLARSWSSETATPLLVGRLSNLYGPAQNLSKDQGLITQVCLRALARQPLNLYVPLDTIRDYLFAEDAGRLIADGLFRLRLEAAEAETAPAVVKVLASLRPTTVATVLAQFRWIMKRPVNVMIASSPNARRQVRDLRMASHVWPELDQRPTTTLSAGMQSVINSILDEAGRGRIGAHAVLWNVDQNRSDGLTGHAQ